VETLGAIWKEQVNTHPDLKCCAFEVDLNGERRLTGSAETNTHTLDLELEHSSSDLVNEIVRIMKESSDASSSIVFHDRGTLESALQDALVQFSYDDLFEISSDWEDSRTHYYEQYVLSSLPVQILDEIELDEEIDGIEEEIARLQEQKLLLKRSHVDNSIDGNLSSCDSQESSNELEADYFPPPPSKPLRKRKRTLDQGTKKTKKIYHEDSIDFELEISFSHISNLERTYASQAKKTKNQKQIKQERVGVAQVLKTSIMAPEDDEDIDILN